MFRCNRASGLTAFVSHSGEALYYSYLPIFDVQIVVLLFFAHNIIKIATFRGKLSFKQIDSYLLAICW